MDELIINAKMDTKGFEAGTKRLASAIKSFGSNVDRSMKTIQGAGRSVLSTIMKWGPALLGVGGAYSIISKSVSAFMSQNQQLQGTLTSCWTAIGNMLGPIITSIVNMIATVVSYLVTFLNLLGLTTKTASQAGQKAGGAAQQLKKQLMGFDELNVMQDNQGGGGGAGGGLQDIDPSDWMKKLADLLKNKMWDEAADMVIERLNDIIYSFRDKAEEWGKIAGEWIQGITHFIARILDETDWKQLGVGIANLLNGLLAEVEGINFGEDLGKIIAAKFTIAFKIVAGFLETFKFDRLGYIVSEMVKSFFDSMSRAIGQANPSLIGQNIASFFNNIDWTGIANSIAKFLKQAWEFATTSLISFLDSVEWKKVGEGIRQFFKNLWNDREEIANTIFEVLKSAWSAVKELLLGMFSEDGEKPPVVDALEKIEELFGAVGEALINLGKIAEDSGFIKFLEEVAKTIGGVFLGAIESLTDKFKDLAYIFDAFDQLLNGKITFGQFLKSIGDVALGVNDMKRTMEESTDAAITAIGQYAEWAANSVAIWDDMEQASTNIVQMKQYVDGYTDSLTENLNGQERASGAVEQLRDRMDELTSRYIQMIENCHSTTEAQQISASMQEELSQITSEYINLLLEQGYSLDDIANALGRSTDEIAKQAGVQTELAEKVGAAAKEEAELVRQNVEMESSGQRAGAGVEAVGTASENAASKVNAASEKFDEFADNTGKSAEKAATSFTQNMNDGSTEMQKAASDAGQKAGEGLQKGLEDTIPEVEASAKELTQSAVDAVNEEVKVGTDTINSTVKASADLITSTVQNCEVTVKNAVTGSRNLITQSFNAIQSTVTSTMNAVNSIIIQVFNSMIQMSGQAGMAIANNFAAGMTELYNAASNVAVSLNDVLGSYFSQIAQNGYVWGSDLGILFNNGLVDACNAYLIPTLSQVAQSIKNVIGFSKPKEGPLSDADTYMPDFMKLMADGVEENMDRPLGAISDLAEGVKEELQDGDYTFGDFEAGELDTAFAAFGTQFLDGFGVLVDRLDAIAEKVIYELPDVAAGTVLPYGVTTGTLQGATGNDVNLRDVLTAIDGLRTFLSTNSGENQGLSVNVFLDGEQIETAVSTRQRRKNMARGA